MYDSDRDSSKTRTPGYWHRRHRVTKLTAAQLTVESVTPTSRFTKRIGAAGPTALCDEIFSSCDGRRHDAWRTGEVNVVRELTVAGLAIVLGIETSR